MAPNSPGGGNVCVGQLVPLPRSALAALPCYSSADGHLDGHHHGHALNALPVKGFLVRYRLRQAIEEAELPARPRALAWRPGGLSHSTALGRNRAITPPKISRIRTFLGWSRRRIYA